MPVTRRALLGTLAFSAARATGQRAEVQGIRTISHDPNSYSGWPTLARTRAGRLLLVCSGGRESHVCPFGRVELMTSDDDGAHWSWPQTLHDSVVDDRDAGVVEAADGSLLATTFTSLAYEDVWSREQADWSAERRRRWEAVQRRTTAAERKSMLGTWMLRSKDGGLNWSKAYRVPLNSPHGPALLSDGRLLYAGKELWTERERVGVAESRDHGKSWRLLAEIPKRPDDDHRAYHELHLVEAANGRLLAHIRNHNPDNVRETLQSESRDGGRTWSVPSAIGVWGLPSHLLRLRDGRLLMSYGYRREPFGNQVRVSEDNGESWSPAITLSDDGIGVDVGYPSTVERDDGSLVTVWYEKRSGSPRAVLRQADWRLR